jgi:anti-sigma regulatory factor (Ser/Thr protein kinase)
VPTPFGPRDQTITAELSRLKEARDFAEAAAREFGLDDDDSYQVKLAMSEAVANAIQHGSASASDPIQLHAVEEAGELALYVTDTGRFVPRVSPRGDFPERGRGLEFMSLIMDAVDVRPGPDGTVLRFSKRRSEQRVA